MMLSIRGLYQILAYVYEIINAYSIKSLMVVPFMNLLKSTLSPIPCKCPVSDYSFATLQVIDKEPLLARWFGEIH